MSTTATPRRTLLEVEVVEEGSLRTMKVGDRVRVKDSVVVYHHPEHRNQAFDIQGQEGEIKSIVREWQGRPVSANFPLYIQFEGKFKAHLRETEVELVESAS